MNTIGGDSFCSANKVKMKITWILVPLSASQQSGETVGEDDKAALSGLELTVIRPEELQGTTATVYQKHNTATYWTTSAFTHQCLGQQAVTLQRAKLCR